MSIPNALATSNKRRLAAAAGRNNQPDPRPLTDYTAVYSEPGGAHSRVTVTLSQPCIIRNPQWEFVSVVNGSFIKAVAITVTSNTIIIFDFGDLIDTSIGFIRAPYQDMEVQNFQGGFVRPGGQWFRKAS